MDGFLTVELDRSILARITESDVAHWMVAKLDELREKEPAISHMTIGVNFRDNRPSSYYDVNWGMHGAGSCAVSHTCTESCMRELVEAMHGNPKQRAADARSKARALLAEAEQLETLSKS